MGHDLPLTLVGTWMPGRVEKEDAVVGHGLKTGIAARADAERIPGAGGNELLMRLVTRGDDPVTVIEGISVDREWLPRHAHPWDELTYVLEGVMEFWIGDQQAVGEAGALVSLPRGVPHSLRVPSGEARYLMIAIGAPAAEFVREVGQAYAEGSALERLVAIAERHGVIPAFGDGC
jgi:mannose-6-phosphate isomerase-like protein (cupin superfamily)